MKLILISNRLPVTVALDRQNIKIRSSAGGLVSGLSDYLTSLEGGSFSATRHLWIGWPGEAIEESRADEVRSILEREFNCYPVFIPSDLMDNFYNGICNKTIWPLFHYFPSHAVFDDLLWRAYEKVNETFCQKIQPLLEPGDIVWVHDYHLMLLPQLLREKSKNLTIGFFLHIPFPSYEMFRLLPRKWSVRILEGMLGADLIGFHTHDYTQHFLKCVLSILGYEHNMGKLLLKDRMVKAETIPMGINFKKFYELAVSPETEMVRDKLRGKFADQKIILSIDRLDYTKGILNRLEGYEIFLSRNPQWHGKVALMMVVVPSRIGVEHYRIMKRQIDEQVGKINGKFGSLNWMPIIYQYKFLPLKQLVALYRLSHVALITPIRDGMNLIAKEYLASRVDGTGVLILSEMAGAARELGEALIVNPNDRAEIASALKQALEMPGEDQKKRIETMQTRLRRYDVVKWGNEFINELFSIKEVQKQFEARLLGNQQDLLIKNYREASRRLIFLDYDGTLVPFAPDPRLVRPPEEVIDILTRLSADQKNEVVIISGRDRKTLEEWLSGLDIGLVAEHGVWLKRKGQDWRMIKPLENYWKQELLPVLEIYVDRLPGSFIEEKEYSLAWHYRACQPELASIRANELVDYLLDFTSSIDVQVLHGNKVVEIRNAGVNKGMAGLSWLMENDYDFILALGDDWTDEDLFKLLPDKAYSIRVGVANTHAKYNLYNYQDVLELLKKLCWSEK